MKTAGWANTLDLLLRGMLDTATPRRIDEYDGAVISRISDYNSNTYDKNDTATVYNIDERNLSYVSSILSQDADFIQDTSDYQWFPDYRYVLPRAFEWQARYWWISGKASSIQRAGQNNSDWSQYELLPLFGGEKNNVNINLRGNNNGVCNNMHTSILSSLCTSYGYNDMARDLDANLAQVDMEDFRTEDIHSLLHGLPQICGTDAHNEMGGEMYASVSGSLMMKYDLDSSISPRSTSQDDSNASFYKSEILFSPVKEVPLVNFSIDSLDCGEHDIMLTCQANKDNYTIAFEGSTVMDKSTDSRYPANENVANLAERKSSESVERMSLDTTSSENSMSANQVDKALICSESPYTTWSKLKVDSAENILKRQSSGNNNTNAFSSSTGYTNLSASCAFLKSQSLPNLNPVQRQFLLSRRMNHSMKQDQPNHHRVTQPNQFVKIYNLSKSQCGRKIHRSVFQNNVNFDLISRFISQKHTANSAYASDDRLGRFSSKTVDNLNQSTTNALDRVQERNENKGCDVFQDSLVYDRATSDAFAADDSCCSFSSHSGGLDASKNGRPSTRTRDVGLPSDEEASDVRCGEFTRNKLYFESAKREHKKRNRVERHDPVKIMDRSMQTSSSDADSAISPFAADESGVTKPVYVMYPNYTLPDLSFLEKYATELDLKNVFLWPQKFSPSPTTECAPPAFGEGDQECEEQRAEKKKKRPCSCPDLETIRNADYRHIRDWESLMFLLPREYRQVLAEDPQLRKYVENLDDPGYPLICTSGLPHFDALEQQSESEAYNSTQPSSGYRGSSTTLSTGSSCENGRCVANRPPLPRGILRNPAVQNIKSRKANAKRNSMFELSREEAQMAPEKRRSLPTQFKDPGSNKPCGTESSYSEDEGVHSSGSHCDSPGPHSELEAKRLESLLETVFHWNETDASQLKIQNSKKTVSFADRHNSTPPNSPICSVSGQQRSPYQMKLHATAEGAIHEECEIDSHDLCNHNRSEARTNSYNFKKELMDAVDEAVKRIIDVGECEETMAQIALDRLCPALYAVLNHGLRPTLETAFGDINNSVWQVVEASSQQGLMTRALHEMVLRLNNEDVLTEGLLKFNAFVFGLLNVRGLDTWFSYLRTRESVLRKHYVDTGILLSSCRGIMSDKQLTDQLVSSLKPLADLVFRLDLLYECRQLHHSLMQLGQNVPAASTRTSWMLKKIVRSLQNQKEKYDESIDDDETFRPRSCVDSSDGFTVNDVASTVRKRWSGVQFGSKLASAFERLAVEDDETYPDSLDHTVNKRYYSTEGADVTCSNGTTDRSRERTDEEQQHRFPAGELKFKQLQKKWEMLAEKHSPPDTLSSRDTFSSRTVDESSVTLLSTRSRIPRLVTSPVRPPSGLHFATLSSGKMGSQLKPQSSPTSPSSGIPTKKIQSPTRNKRVELSVNKMGAARIRNTSLEDGSAPSLHSARPNSLARRPSSSSRIQQRKVTDNSRRPTTSSRYANIVSKYVRTLGHRLPSDTGHLSYNDGEKLRVVLEVDDKWILCCRGDQKGLVPRSAVLPISEHL